MEDCDLIAMKNFLIITPPRSNSQYNAFAQFNKFYLDVFKQLGGEIRYLDKDMIFDSETLNHAFMFYFGYADNLLLWKIYRTLPLLPIVNHTIDHPFDSFVPTPEFGGYVPSYLPLAFDPTWIDFIGRHRKQPNSPPFAALTIPLAGFTYPEVTTFKPTLQREIEILFAGSTVDPEALRKTWHTQAPQLAQAIDSIVEHTTSNYGIQIDVLLENGLNPECVQDVHCIATIFQYVNEYTRAHYRLKLLRTLAHANIPVTLYTNHPDLLNQLIDKHRFDIRPPVDFSELLKLMAQSKMVLNCRPNTHGMTERVPSTMLNGAVSINDTNSYLSQEFIDGQEAVFYDYQKLEELPDKIFNLLSHPEQLEEIAAAGQHKAQQHHTVLHRVKTILENVEQFRAMLIAAHQS